MNIRKLFAILAGVSMVANVVLPGLANAATPDTELGRAYEWARSKDITTMPSYEAANMYGNITRAELAKMLSNWAMNVKGLTPDTSAVCNFTDTDSVKGDLHDFITTSCQLGLMGQGIKQFRPYDSISRAEFGTALSRALWGDKYNTDETPYYAKHLNALKEAGIMTQIANAESMKEVRGYVMLMLMRSEGDSICDDVVVKVTCAAEAVDGTYKDCPTVCRDNGNNTDNVVKSGDLSVAAKAASSRKVVVGGVSDMDTINLKTSEDSITLTKVSLERYGYSSDKDVANVWLENEDGVAITEPKALNSKDQVTLNIKKEYRTLSSNDVFTIVVETNKADDTWTQGTTIGFKVTGIESSAANVDLDDYDPYTYDMVTYEGGTISVDVKGKNEVYHFENNESYEVAKFKVKGETTTALVNGVVLTNGGDLDLEDWLEDVEVTVDGKAVKSSWSLDDDELTISFNDVEVAQKTSSLFTVKVTLAKDFDDFGDAVQFSIAKTSDLKAVEKKTGSRVKVTLNTAIALNSYTFNGSKITLTNKKLGTVDATAGTSDVVVGEGTIELGGQEVKLNKFYVGATAGVEAMRLVFGNDEFEGKAATATNCNASATTCWEFTVSTDESGKVQFIADVDDDATDNIEFTFNKLSTASFGKNVLKATDTGVDYLGKYDGGKYITPEDLVGSISLSTLKVQPAKGSLENEITKNYEEFKKGETSKKTIFDGTYTAKKQNIYLNTYELNEDDNLGTDTEITFHVWVNGTEVDTDTLSAGQKKLEGSFSDVLVKAGETATVKVEAEAYIGDGDTNSSYTFELTVSGDNEDGEDGQGEDSDDCIRMDLVTTSSMAISSPSANDVVLKADGYMDLASFILKANSDEEDDVDLDSFTFTINGNVNVATDNIRVKIGSSTYKVEKNSDVYSVVDLDETLDNEGSKVTISAKGLDGATSIELVTPKARTFNKYIVPALVRVTSQTDLDGSTKYVVSVEKYKNGYSVKNIKLGSHTGIGGEFTDGDDFEIEGANSVELISNVSYDVYDEEGVKINPSVSIDKGTYNDYFKVGGSYLRVYKVD